MGILFSKKSMRASLFLMAISFIFATIICGDTFAAPLLYFSDLIIGPSTGIGDGLGSGAIVTIWGVNLGSSQGTSTVSFTDSAQTIRVASHVYEWGNATAQSGHPADLYTYHKMQRISFSIPAHSASGAGTIKVTVGGVSSNNLPFTIAASTIMYVSPTGRNSGSCTFSRPCQTLNYLLNAGEVSSGTIIYVKDGYNDTTGVIVRYVSGTASAPVSVIAYPGAVATINNTNGAIGNYNASSTYLNFAKLVLKGDYGVAAAFDGMRFIANEVTQSKCAAGQVGALGTGTGGQQYPDLIVYYGNYLHDFGAGCPQDNKTHTTYFSNRFNGISTWSSFLLSGPINFAWNYLQNNGARGGIHIYDENHCAGWTSTPWQIHDNVIVNQRGWAIDINGGCAPGWVMTLNANIYNNLIINGGLQDSWGDNYPVINLWNCAVGGHCADYRSFGSAPGPSGTINFYNNTIYGGSEITKVYSGDIYGLIAALNLKWPPSTGATSWLHWNMFNNIAVTTNCSIPYTTPSYRNNVWTNPDSSGHNLWYCSTGSLAAPSWDVSPLNVNPLFTNSKSNDFSLQPGSPAIDAGIAESIVTTDILGTIRPQGSAYDIGAFEYSQ